ncbi:putative cullin 2 [Trypanosoma grayi]|uniref:putative cullin 2 n=1 Tax=Trypanosoma grayi TaxID=71804 RepID=UPI0004F430D0|nr:putative cullin 2 [Trypanosoma grayi]KEG13068.1 putative cullin 2 [Trypanosoma grayi]
MLEPQPNLLRAYVAHWKTFIVAVNNLKVVFSYLHGPWQKYGLPPEHPLLPTGTVALLQWSEVVTTREICDALSTQIFDYVDLDRRKKLDDATSALLREVSQSLGMLNDQRHTLYVLLIEEPYVGLLYNHTREKIPQLKSEGIVAYVERANSIFDIEAERANRLLNKSSLSVVMHRLADALINDELSYLKEIMPDWILTNSAVCLRRLYRLMLKSTSGMTELKNAFQKCVFEKGTDEVKRRCEKCIRSNGNIYKAILEAVISVHAFFEEVKTAFDQNEGLMTAMCSGLASVLSDTAHAKNPKMLGQELAQLADTELKSCGTEDHCEYVVKQIVTLFQLLPLKNPFLEAYPKYLSSRLLFDDFKEKYERLAILHISRIKDCSSDFVHRCEVMLSDVTENSVALRDMFYSSRIEGQSFAKRLFHPIIIRSYTWPDAPCSLPLPVPPFLTHWMSEFQAFFVNRRPRRHIVYNHRLSRGVVRMSFPRGSRLASIDLYIGQSQLILTECFNRHAEWSLSGLVQAMEVKNQDICLCAINTFAREGILEVYGATGLTALPLRTLIPNQYVRIGSKPNTTLRRLELFAFEEEGHSQIASGDSTMLSKHHVDAAYDAMDKMKSSAIQAIVIRIFKSNGVLSFTELVEKVRDESLAKFTPSVQQIKVALEFLIGRGFVRRDDTSEGMFSYVS